MATVEKTVLKYLCIYVCKYVSIYLSIFLFFKDLFILGMYICVPHTRSALGGQKVGPLEQTLLML